MSDTQFKMFWEKATSRDGNGQVLTETLCSNNITTTTTNNNNNYYYYYYSGLCGVIQRSTGRNANKQATTTTIIIAIIIMITIIMIHVHGELSWFHY